MNSLLLPLRLSTQFIQHNVLPSFHILKQSAWMALCLLAVPTLLLSGCQSGNEPAPKVQSENCWGPAPVALEPEGEATSKRYTYDDGVVGQLFRTEGGIIQIVLLDGDRACILEVSGDVAPDAALVWDRIDASQPMRLSINTPEGYRQRLIQYSPLGKIQEDITLDKHDMTCSTQAPPLVGTGNITHSQLPVEFKQGRADVVVNTVDMTPSALLRVEETVPNAGVLTCRASLPKIPKETVTFELSRTETVPYLLKGTEDDGSIWGQWSYNEYGQMTPVDDTLASQ